MRKINIYAYQYHLTATTHVETSTAESNGIIEAASLRFGATLAELKKTDLIAQVRQ